MPVDPLFPRSANSWARVGFFSPIALVLGVPLFLMAWVRTPIVTGEEIPVHQPLMFDHRHHALDDGIDCLYCHTEAERSPRAGFPSTDVCMGCHAQIWNGSEITAPLRLSVIEGRPMRWNRVFDLPDFAYFNHQQHVTRGVRCADCHGPVEAMAVVYPVYPLNMGWCLDCHREPEAYLGAERVADHDLEPPTHCSACHR